MKLITTAGEVTIATKPRAKGTMFGAADLRLLA